MIKKDDTKSFNKICDIIKQEREEIRLDSYIYVMKEYKDSSTPPPIKKNISAREREILNFLVEESDRIKKEVEKFEEEKGEPQDENFYIYYSIFINCLETMKECNDISIQLFLNKLFLNVENYIKILEKQCIFIKEKINKVDPQCSQDIDYKTFFLDLITSFINSLNKELTKELTKEPLLNTKIKEEYKLANSNLLNKLPSIAKDEKNIFIKKRNIYNAYFVWKEKEEVFINERLTAFDKAIYNFLCLFYLEYKNREFSINSLYKTLINKNIDNDKVPKEATKEIINSILKMRNIDLFIDRKLTFFLPIEVFPLNNNLRFLAAPEIYIKCEGFKQIIQIDRRWMSIPSRFTKLQFLIVYFFSGYVKSIENEKVNNKISFEKIYENLEKSDASSSEKNDIKKCLLKILDKAKKEGLIKGYVKNKKEIIIFSNDLSKNLTITKK